MLLQLRRGTGYMDGHWAAAAAGHVEAGESVLEQLRQERNAHLTSATADWSPAELATFTDHLRRFVQDLSDHLGAASSGAANSSEKDR